MYRTASAVTAVVLMVGLSACGAGSSSTDATTTVTVTETSTSEEPEPETSSTSKSIARTPTPTDEIITQTTLTELWVDDSWTITEMPKDLCEWGDGSQSLYGSIFSKQDGIFRCGGVAMSADTCAVESGGVTTCITGATSRHAMRFTSPVAQAQEVEPRQQPAIPLYVELDDGATCSPVSHDHSEHWNQKLSWYICSEGSELLTDNFIGDTFDTSGDLWTVQRSFNKEAPTRSSVKTAVFAGK